MAHPVRSVQASLARMSVDEELCTVFLLVALSTIASTAVLVCLLTGRGKQLAHQLPCIPCVPPSPPRAASRWLAYNQRAAARVGAPQHLYNLLHPCSLEEGCGAKEP